MCRAAHGIYLKDKLFFRNSLLFCRNGLGSLSAGAGCFSSVTSICSICHGIGNHNQVGRAAICADRTHARTDGNGRASEPASSPAPLEFELWPRKQENDTQQSGHNTHNCPVLLFGSIKRKCKVSYSMWGRRNVTLTRESVEPRERLELVWSDTLGGLLKRLH